MKMKPSISLLASILTRSSHQRIRCASHGRAVSSSLIALEEISIPTSDGTVLAAQRWTKKRNTYDEKEISYDRTILCTHGWIDNCGTHHYLAPKLALALNDDDDNGNGAKQTSTEIIAMDFPGHGWSSHKSNDAPPLVNADLSFYLSEAIHTLLETTVNPKKKITLIGHSLGASVASLTAAAFPELVDQLVLLDAAGFLPREAENTVEHVRSHIQRKREHYSTPRKEPRIYPNLEKAIKVRQFTSSKMPGKQLLSYEAARAIVLRGTRPVFKKEKEGHSKGNVEPVVDCDEDVQIQFRHDPRYTWPSIQYMTIEQVEAILRCLGQTNVDACLIVAQDGWPVAPERLRRIRELLQPSVFKSLPGTHHFHANPETAEAVSDAIIQFLKRNTDY